jgi:transcriptional regulator with XRE-family HTH domain
MNKQTPTMEIFISAVKERIKSKHLTQKQLAVNCGLFESTLCRYFKLNRNINLNNLIKMCKFLHLSVDELFELEPEYSEAYKQKHFKET